MIAVKVYATRGHGLAEAAPSTRWQAGASSPTLSEEWLRLLEACRCQLT
jgi:hypothetical protein